MVKSILITGAAGHIGSNLYKWILLNKPEYMVIALDDLSGGYLEWIPDGGLTYLRNCGADLSDVFEKNNISIVYHCAAEAAESVANFKRRFYYQSNIVNSANIINHSINYGVDRLVFFSSMAVYGHNDAPFVESQIPMPQDCYGIGKYAVELDLLSAKHQHGLKYTIVRPHSVYGPNQNLYDAYRNVLAIWMRQVLNGEPLTIYGDGSQRRAFTYINDILEPLWKCGTTESTLWETFNIGNDDDISILDASKLFLQTIEKPDYNIEFCPLPHEVKNAYSRHNKVESVLGMKCNTSLADGLALMWNWAQSEPKRSIQKFKDFEIYDGLQKQFR